MAPFVLPIRYALFAGVATGINLATQVVALALYHGPEKLTAAMVAGTGTGLLTKYLLDKRWIFYDTSRGMIGHARKGALYTSTGVLTTALFWATEYAFDALTSDGRWRFLGAAIGLTLGYALKYRLDHRYVFGGAGA
jgi:putative flippase GtrA